MTSADRGRPAPENDLGGDPACWLDRVCPECGRFQTDAADAAAGVRPATCAECGAELPNQRAD